MVLQNLAKIAFECIVQDCACVSEYSTCVYTVVGTLRTVFVVLSRMATCSSCEPMRISAYSEDKRWRMVWQRGSVKFRGSPWTVHRIIKKFEGTGSVSKVSYRKPASAPEAHSCSTNCTT